MGCLLLEGPRGTVIASVACGFQKNLALDSNW